MVAHHSSRWMHLLGLLVASVTLWSEASAGGKASLPRDDEALFIQNFFKSHCVKCHGAKNAKGGVRLDQIDQRVSLGFDFETWTSVHEKMRTGQMPPEDEAQPDDRDRIQVLASISVGLEKAKESDRVRYLSAQFAFGNQVSPDKLFGGAAGDKSLSPPRLWRINPNIYDRQSIHFNSQCIR